MRQQFGAFGSKTFDGKGGVGLKLPTFSFHKLFERHAPDTEVATYVRYLGRVCFKGLHRDDHTIFHRCPSDNERIGVTPTFQKFLLLKILLEVLHSVNSRHERGFVSR